MCISRTKTTGEKNNEREDSVDPGDQHIRNLLLVLVPLLAVLFLAIVLLGRTGVCQKVCDIGRRGGHHSVHGTAERHGITKSEDDVGGVVDLPRDSPHTRLAHLAPVLGVPAMESELDIGDEFEDISRHEQSQADVECTVGEQRIPGRRGEGEAVDDLDDHARGDSEPEEGLAQFLARKHVDPKDLLDGEVGGHEGG